MGLGLRMYIMYISVGPSTHRTFGCQGELCGSGGVIGWIKVNDVSEGGAVDAWNKSET